MKAIKRFQKSSVKSRIKRKSIFSQKTKIKSDLSQTDLKSWSLLVRERDQFTCISCGKKGKKLHAHHVISKARNPSLAYDVSVGVTLCKRCHMGSHGVHGNGPPINSLVRLLRSYFKDNDLNFSKESIQLLSFKSSTIA